MEKEREKIYSHALGNEIKRVRGTTVHFFLENIIHGTDEEVALSKELTFSKFASVIGEKAIKELLSDENIEYILNKNRDFFLINGISYFLNMKYLQKIRHLE